MFENAEVIHAYTRAQALADGELVDVSEAAAEAGFRRPVALTRAVWADCVAVPEGREVEDEAGRLWDVLWMASWAARRQAARPVGDGGPDQLAAFDVLVSTRRGGPLRRRRLRLWAWAGPGDGGEPTVTIMFPEDY